MNIVIYIYQQVKGHTGKVHNLQRKNTFTVECAIKITKGIF